MRLAWPEMTGGFADLGGDFAFSGRPLDAAAWRVAVADPRSPGAILATLQLNDGGVATSGRDRRRFGPGRSLHHLIDPETGTPAVRGPLAVTVVARDPSEAEALGTAFAISEPDDVRRLARERGVAALYIPATREPGRGRQPAARAALPNRDRGMTGAAAAVPVAWIVARAAGLVAFGLLTLSVWLGLAMSTRILGPRRQKSLFGWHRTLAWTGLSMLGLHVGAVLLDPVLHFGLASVLVPFAASWRPAAIASGVIAGWLSLMLAVSFRLRKWIGQRGWRRLHYASFAAFGLALAHALTAGTDLIGIRGSILAAIALGPVLWLGFARILLPRAARPPPASCARRAVTACWRRRLRRDCDARALAVRPAIVTATATCTGTSRAWLTRQRSSAVRAALRTASSPPGTVSSAASISITVNPKRPSSRRVMCPVALTVASSNGASRRSATAASVRTKQDAAAVTSKSSGLQ